MPNAKKGGNGPNQRLRDERLRRRWSQKELADRLGTTPNNVSRWELGTTSPDPFFRTRLCDLFGTSVADWGLQPTGRKTADRRFPPTRPPLQTSGFLPVNPQGAAETLEEVRNEGREALYDPAIPVGARRGLVGRAPLLPQLRQSLCETEHPASLALHGLPGVGKTMLAVELAHDPAIRDTFRDGILWAGLGPSPHLLGQLSRWGTLLGMDADQAAVRMDINTWTLAIRTLIDTRRMLIILDDAWQSEDVQAFKVGGPHCAYLLTTRHPEVATRFTLDAVVAVEELEPVDGLCLLAALAPEVLTWERQLLLDLVQSVGGLPLALVLLGNYLRVHAYSQQPGRIQRALTRMRSPEERIKLMQPRDPLESPSVLPASTAVSLQTVIGVSDDALDKNARLALRALACLPSKPNTFSEEAALAIADTPGETLDTLFDAGLLESRGSGRYTLHQTIVDYARTQGADRQAEERMIAYFTAVVESWGVQDAPLEREAENILAAFQLACQREAWPTLVRGVHALAPFLAARGIYPMVKPYLIQARQALSQRNEGSAPEAASVCFHLGRIADFQGAYPEADFLYAAGVEGARSFGEEPLMISLLAHWGEMLLNAGHYQRAETVLLEGLQLAQALDSGQQSCLFFKNLGEVAASLGNYAQAILYHQQGLELARQLEEGEMVSALLQNLASHHACLGDFQRAEDSYREALTYARAVRHLQRCSAALSGLGFTLLRRQCFSEAEVCLQESLTLARKIHSPVRTGCVLQNLGILKSEQGDYDAAGVYFQESLDIASAIGHTWLIGETLYYWGEFSLKQDRIEDARKAFGRAYKQAREQGELELLALTAFGLARVCWLGGKLSQADAFAEESLVLFRNMGHEQAERVVAWLQGR